MPVKLVVTKVNEPDSPDEYVFEQLPVVVGRAGGSHLMLPDLKKVVSKEHARIDEHEGQYFLTDLHSKNHTFLNGERVAAGQPYPINEGDSFSIGDFIMQFLPIAVSAMDFDERTVFDFNATSNPFEEAAHQLVNVVQELRAAYDQESASHRQDSLRSAIQMALLTGGNAVDQHEVVSVISEILSPQQTVLHKLPPSETITQEPEPLPQPEIPPYFPQPTNARQERVLGVFAEAGAQLVSVPWQFRYEFIGQTIMQPTDTAFLYEGDGEMLKNALLSPEVSDQEFEDRLEHLRQALRELTMHQVALLDGYKAAVQEGGTRMLDTLDPDVVAEQLDLDSPIFKLLPSRAKAEVVEVLEDRVDEMRRDDWSVVEQRAYRPSFIKAYLARMTSSPR